MVVLFRFMNNINKNSFLFQDISSIKGVGKKLEKYLKNKKIEKIKDLIVRPSL